MPTGFYMATYYNRPLCCARKPYSHASVSSESQHPKTHKAMRPHPDHLQPQTTFTYNESLKMFTTLGTATQRAVKAQAATIVSTDARNLKPKPKNPLHEFRV